MVFRDDASLRDELNAITPRLRRYARALTSGHAGNSDGADDLVQVTLMRALGARHVGPAADLVIRLYATVTQLHRESLALRQQAQAAGAGRPVIVARDGRVANVRHSRLSGALVGLALENREALLLVALEGFSHTEAARILRISRAVLLSRLTQARSEVDKTLQGADATGRPAAGLGPAAGLAPPAGLGPARQRVPYLRVVT